MGGKHRAPSQHKVAKALTKAGTVALATTAPIGLSGNIAQASPAPTGILDVIAKCESGNTNINTRGASTASGFFQILDSTWRSFGGLEFASRAINANRAEQAVVAQRILAGQGIQAWNPSRGCWEKKITLATPEPVQITKPQVVPPVTHAVVAPKIAKKVVVTPKPVKAIAHAAAASYLIKKGDTLSGIARSHHSTVRTLLNANHDTVRNPNLIFAGKHLRLA